jgi:YebC/PmpR family DNA-binding regulatory protein
MSGHSKWATIKRAKAKTDAARGKAFTKIIREITTAAKIGGGDINGNPRLRLAIDKAKEANMPADNIKRAIDKATGAGGVIPEEITYEGYGPGGVAVIIEAMTDNKNRTLGDVRNILERNGGNLGASGSVAWMFKRKGSLTFNRAEVDEEKLTMSAIDAGAEDVLTEETVFEVVTNPENFEKIRDVLKTRGFNPANAEVTMVPANTVKLTGEAAHKVLKLVGALEEHDDVQAVHANFDIPDEIIEQESK